MYTGIRIIWIALPHFIALTYFHHNGAGAADMTKGPEPVPTFTLLSLG